MWEDAALVGAACTWVIVKRSSERMKKYIVLSIAVSLLAGYGFCC